MTDLSRVNQIGDWLDRYGLGVYRQCFHDNDIDFRALPDIGDQDLKDLGLSLGHRRILLRAIAELGGDDAIDNHPYRRQKTVSPTGQIDSPGSPERRQLTILFCDLVGSTVMSQTVDDEILLHINRTFQMACSTAIERYGGYVARFMGDGLLAYFGYPQAHEDAAERAVHSALAVVEAVKRLRHTLGAEHGVELQVRVAANTGPVVVGDIVGKGLSRERSVVGEAANIAAHLQAIAAPNSVVIGPATYQLVGRRFKYEDLGAHQLKGIRTPMPVRRVVAEVESESRFASLRRTQLTPLVGRERELGLILERWARASIGDGQVVRLSGPPGIGKSRIVEALRQRTPANARTELILQCSPYHDNSRLYPFVRQLEHSLQFGQRDSDAVRLDKLEGMLARIVDGNVATAASILASLLSIDTGDRYTSLALTPERQKEETLNVLIAQVVALSAEKPLLFIFEDAHWADPTSLELLALIIEQTPRLPVLVVVTHRSERTPGWVSYPYVTSLSLKTLPPETVGAMVQEITGGKSLPPELHQHILNKTDGVPLFVEELTHSLLESDLLVEQRSAYVIAKPIHESVVPATLKDSLVARLDRLGQVKEIAQCASVIGREFRHDLLLAITRWTHDQLAEALEQLIRAGLIYPLAHPGSTVYAFKHALVRDAAYETLLRRTLQALHGRIANTIVTSIPELAGDEPEIVAHHYIQANQPDQAPKYLLQAGRYAARRSFDQEAVAHLQKGLDLLRNLPESEDLLRQELAFHLAMFGPLMSTRGYRSEHASGYYRRARELCEALNESRQYFDVLHGEWLQNFVKGNFRAAARLAAEFHNLSKEHDDPIAVMDGHRLVAWTALNTGALDEAGRHVKQALRLSDPNTPHRPVHDAQITGLACRLCYEWLVGRCDDSRATAAEMLARANDIGHANSLAIAYMYKGFGEVMQRDVSRAQDTAAKLVPLARAHGFPHWETIGGIIGGWAAAHQCDPNGPERIRAAIDGLTRSGQRMWHPMYFALLAEVLLDQRHPDAAERALKEAFDNLDVTGGTLWEAELHRLDGELQATTRPDDVGRIEAKLKRALSVARQQGAAALELRAASSLAREWMRRNKSTDALKLLLPVCRKFNQGLDSPDLTSAQRLLRELA